MRVPEGLDWEIDRLHVSGRFGIRHPREVLLYWSQEDVDRANAALDFQMELEEPAHDE